MEQFVLNAFEKAPSRDETRETEREGDSEERTETKEVKAHGQSEKELTGQRRDI